MTNSTSTYRTLLYRLGRRADDESGFTLIELLVTMLVAALLAVVVIFALGGFTGQAQGSNAESMAQVVKTTAIARGTFYDGGLFASSVSGPITAASLQADQAGIDLTATDPVHLASFTPVLSDGVTACTAANASTCVGFNLTVNAADGTFTDTYSIKYNGTAYTYPDSVKGVAGTW